jgi:hypothetical protein
VNSQSEDNKMGSDEKDKETDPALPKPPANTDQITAVIGKQFEKKNSFVINVRFSINVNFVGKLDHAIVICEKLFESNYCGFR